MHIDALFRLTTKTSRGSVGRIVTEAGIYWIIRNLSDPIPVVHGSRFVRASQTRAEKVRIVRPVLLPATT